ncbi:conserved hypothetical protein [Lysobacter enzymogenes]|uniref:Metalloprotease StcE beta-sandwich domain-containing protein n=3 Tax=Bacteria TaxID=2 RepID=A0AAU9APG2_LYSEN|nr:conserved hypothetical protein [Lysobacter enzymogenes]
MKHLLSLVLALSGALSLPSFAQTVALTPNSNGGSGTLPNGFDQIDFSMRDHDWVRTVILPSAPRNGARVNITTRAQWASHLDASGVDAGVSQIDLPTNASYSLSYSAAEGVWTLLSGNSVTSSAPANGAAVIADNPNKITYMRVSDAVFASKVSLPKTAADGSIVVVKSSAAAAVTVDPGNRAYVSSATLRGGDSFAYLYRSDIQGWISTRSTARQVAASAIVANNGTLPLAGSPRNLVTLTNADRVDQIVLPASAGDRDRITIRSQASADTVIAPANTGLHGTTTVRNGDEYQFMYVGPRQRWELMSNPSAFHQAGALPANGQLPDMVAPRMVVNAADGNTRAELLLPVARKTGDRVTIKTQASTAIKVRSGQTALTPLAAGEQVTFVADANRTWQRQTVTIDMLMLYSAKAATQLGADTMRARLVEGLGMTNDALENSIAKPRFRTVSTQELTPPDTWTTQTHALNGAKDLAQVKTWRTQSKADGIYYEGTEEGCGQGFLGGNADFMIGVGMIHCGTDVMRHELGHNMNLDHNTHFESGARLVMHPFTGGAPFFATPFVFLPELGIPMTVTMSGLDEVKVLDGRAPTVAAFR